MKNQWRAYNEYLVQMCEEEIELKEFQRRCSEGEFFLSKPLSF
jgi:hypothetical protein